MSLLNFGSLLFLGLFSSTAFAFDCSNLKEITRELIEVEWQGIRYQGGESKCLNSKQFKRIVSRHRPLGDPALLKPEHLVKKGTTFKVISQKNKPGDLVEVVYEYQTVDGKTVRDEILYLLFFGKKVAKRGCAGMLNGPKAFAMREECLP